MSNGDFGAELQQSVNERLEAIRSSLAQAKARIASGISGAAPDAQTPVEPAAENVASWEDPA
ncbi:MAG: hypothetical protein M3R51_06490 [Candidatus Eremiobacteraeota bacterium]|nr:hypothetical protein [Candidatus Eremiobacteraeota bacterium]